MYWVKAHADNLKRKSTEDEKGNQTVDALANQAYEKLMNKEIGQRGVIDQNTFTMEGAEVYIQGVRLNGSVGQQIKEQVQVEAAKRAARMKAPQWGVVQEEIEWKEMLRTCKNKTIADRRRLMQDMWDGRWTNKKLFNIGWESKTTCSMCNTEEETLEHLMLQCPCFRGAREKVPHDVVELIDKAGSNKTLQTAVHLVLGVHRGAVPNY